MEAKLIEGNRSPEIFHIKTSDNTAFGKVRC